LVRPSEIIPFDPKVNLFLESFMANALDLESLTLCVLDKVWHAVPRHCGADIAG